MVADKVLPWLQDQPDVDAWKKWGAQYRDVIIVDEQNHAVGLYNLTEHDLSTQANYERLKAMLLGAP